MSITRVLGFLFNGPWPLTFAMVGVFGGVFGGLFAVVTADLAMAVHANLDFVLEHGAWGLMQGGALQALQLAAMGYLSLALYVLFKGCLYSLLGRFQKR